jgi:hypothetical protein
MCEQLINCRRENEAALLIQNGNTQIQQFQGRINDFQSLTSQQQGALTTLTI